jgi:hypothetical protein
LFLELFNGLLELDSNPFVTFGQFNNPHQPVFSLDSQLAQTIVQHIQLRIIRDVRIWNMNLVLLVLVHWNQTAALSLDLHLLKYLYQTLKLLLKLLSRCPSQWWQLVSELFMVGRNVLTLGFFGSGLNL